MTDTAWTRDEVAGELLGRRDELLRRLPRRIRDARNLTEDQRELIVDEAATYVVMEHNDAITSADEADRLFWHAVELRVTRAHDRRRRNQTVRGRFVRAGVDDLEHVAAPREATDPALVVERAVERDIAAEFAATLTELEGRYLRAKWLTKPYRKSDNGIGYEQVARVLDIPTRRARAAERSITDKLDRFAALIAAGRLCQDRTQDISAVAEGLADPAQSNLAHAHLEHCTTCRVDFAAQLRVLRSADFARRVAITMPPISASEDHTRGLLAEILNRILGHTPDAAAASDTASQAAAITVGRGAGAALAAKVAALLAAGAATIGAATGAFEHHDPAAKRARPSPTPIPTATATPTATPRPTPTAPPNLAPAVSKAARVASRAISKRQPTTQGGSSPSSHERTPVSPASPGSLPSGQSEFTPGAADSSTPPPAPVQKAPGSSEFP